MSAVPANATTGAAHALPHDRWRRLEIAFWLLPVAAFFSFPAPSCSRQS